MIPSSSALSRLREVLPGPQTEELDSTPPLKMGLELLLLLLLFGMKPQLDSNKQQHFMMRASTELLDSNVNNRYQHVWLITSVD